MCVERRPAVSAADVVCLACHRSAEHAGLSSAIRRGRASHKEYRRTDARARYVFPRLRSGRSTRILSILAIARRRSVRAAERSALLRTLSPAALRRPGSPSAPVARSSSDTPRTRANRVTVPKARSLDVPRSIRSRNDGSTPARFATVARGRSSSSRSCLSRVPIVFATPNWLHGGTALCL